MSENDPNESSANEPVRGGSGPMIVILLACILLCAGSIGGIGFVGWRMAQRAEEEEAAEVARQAEALQKELVDPQGLERFAQVARAVAEGLKADDRLADSYTANGKPLLSWRVHLLPRLGEEAMYRRFKLDQPWDSPANRNLAYSVPQVYVPTTNTVVGRWTPGWTHIRGFSHPGAIFEPGVHYTLKDIPGGPKDTFAIVDSAEPDFWTKPDTLRWEPDGRTPKFGWISPDRNAFLAATVDGRVWQIRRTIPDAVLRPLFDRRIPHEMDFLPHVERN
jgi:hypothetical protein